MRNLRSGIALSLSPVMDIAQHSLKLYPLIGSACLLLLSSTALANANSSAKLINLSSVRPESLTIEYKLEGSSDGIDGMCVILDYDFTDGFYQFAPVSSSRRQVNCNSSLSRSFTFTGLRSDTRYWLSIYPYQESGQGILLNGHGVAGLDIKTDKPRVTFTATASNIYLTSVTLSTSRIPNRGEFYQASCTPFTGLQQSESFTQSMSMDVVYLKPNTRYSCRIYIFSSPTGGTFLGSSDEVVFTTSENDLTKVVCRTIPEGGGVQCEKMDADLCNMQKGRAYTTESECWSGKAKTVCGFVSHGGRIQCEETNASECAAQKGMSFTSLDSCSKHAEKSICGFKSERGEFQCQEIITGSCQAMDGTGYPSFEKCRSGKGKPDSGKRDKVGANELTPSSTIIPPAGYEDEVLVNMSVFSNPFPDTTFSDLSGKAAAELYRRSVIGGFPDGEFKGDRSVNRAEAAKFLLLARYGTVNDIANNGRFPDVLDNQWYTKFVLTAADKGIIKGYPNGLFKPGDQVNTAEFLKMFSLTFGLPLNMSYNYDDVTSDSWFAPYAGIAQKYDLFPSRTSYLSSEKPLSRSDVAVAIYQYLSKR